jgi:hypothetical protein
MLYNEKYKCDALLKKTYTVDFLTKKRVENNGEIPQYYVKESHFREESYVVNVDVHMAERFGTRQMTT